MTNHIQEILKRETKGINIDSKTRNSLLFSYDEVEGMLEELKKRLEENK